MKILDIWIGEDYPKSVVVTSDKNLFSSIDGVSPISYILVDEIAPMTGGITTATHVSIRLKKENPFFSKEDTAQLVLTGLDVERVYVRREEVVN